MKSIGAKKTEIIKFKKGERIFNRNLGIIYSNVKSTHVGILVYICEINKTDTIKFDIIFNESLLPIIITQT